MQKTVHGYLETSPKGKTETAPESLEALSKGKTESAPKLIKLQTKGKTKKIIWAIRNII